VDASLRWTRHDKATTQQLDGHATRLHAGDSAGAGSARSHRVGGRRERRGARHGVQGQRGAHKRTREVRRGRRIWRDGADLYAVGSVHIECAVAADGGFWKLPVAATYDQVASCIGHAQTDAVCSPSPIRERRLVGFCRAVARSQETAQSRHHHDRQPSKVARVGRSRCSQVFAASECRRQHIARSDVVLAKREVDPSAHFDLWRRRAGQDS
jgi:hypothetical protein